MIYYRETDEDSKLERIGDADALEDFADHAESGEVYALPHDAGYVISRPTAFSEGGKIVEIESTVNAHSDKQEA
jgi:hypothetical protein